MNWIKILIFLQLIFIVLSDAKEKHKPKHKPKPKFKYKGMYVQKN